MVKKEGKSVCGKVWLCDETLEMNEWTKMWESSKNVMMVDVDNVAVLCFEERNRV